VYRELHTGLKAELIDIAVYESWFQQRMLASVTTLRPEIFDVPARQMLVSAVTSRPFQGRLLREWVDGLDAGRFARLRDAIRIGVVEGESIDQIVRRVRGTRVLRFKDGILDISRRSAEAVVRTAVNHTATHARSLMYAENADVVESWQFVAVLDSRTTEICMGLDGQVFPVGEGPEPPRHINCRSTTVPVLKGEKPAERQTYGSWLKRQSAATQDEILGSTKARLFRSGGLSVDRFANDNRAFTIAELKHREAAAFKRAGVQ
jgi:SPP1 gp7 family putative phage head morphogenesis protein